MTSGALRIVVACSGVEAEWSCKLSSSEVRVKNLVRYWR